MSTPRKLPGKPPKGLARLLFRATDFVTRHSDGRQATGSQIVSHNHEDNSSQIIPNNHEDNGSRVIPNNHEENANNASDPIELALRKISDNIDCAVRLKPSTEKLLLTKSLQESCPKVREQFNDRAREKFDEIVRARHHFDFREDVDTALEWTPKAQGICAFYPLQMKGHSLETLLWYPIGFPPFEYDVDYFQPCHKYTATLDRRQCHHRRHLDKGCLFSSP